MRVGIAAVKEGISSVFDSDGRVFSITTLKIQPGKVMSVFEKQGVVYSVKVLYSCFGNSLCREFRVDNLPGVSVGSLWDSSVLNWDSFSSVDVTGTSKGRGFQGVVKRFGFSGGPASHGCSKFHRRPGSIGMRSYPGRVFKGRKMPGRMGGVRRTISNLEIFNMNLEKGILLVKGSVPGCRGGLVFVSQSLGGF